MSLEGLRFIRLALTLQRHADHPIALLQRLIALIRQTPVGVWFGALLIQTEVDALGSVRIERQGYIERFRDEGRLGAQRVPLQVDCPLDLRIRESERLDDYLVLIQQEQPEVFLGRLRVAVSAGKDPHAYDPVIVIASLELDSVPGTADAPFAGGGVVHVAEDLWFGWRRVGEDHRLGVGEDHRAQRRKRKRQRQADRHNAQPPEASRTPAPTGCVEDRAHAGFELRRLGHRNRRQRGKHTRTQRTDDVHQMPGVVGRLRAGEQDEIVTGPLSLDSQPAGGPPR